MLQLTFDLASTPVEYFEASLKVATEPMSFVVWVCFFLSHSGKCRGESAIVSHRFWIERNH